MKKLLIYYNFVIVVVVVVGGYLSAQSLPQLATATFFFPLLLYFTLKVRPKRNKAIILPVEAKKSVPPSKSKKKTKSEKIEKAEVVRLDEDEKAGYDKERRAFVKLIGSAGISVFIFSIFGVKKANAAFFGSTPGPGTVSLKNIAGDKIDPAEKLPTDGYRIAELDDSIPGYYGFTDMDGKWFIMMDDGAGAYRYTRGDDDFINVTTGWPNRDNLTYDYFENVFD